MVRTKVTPSQLTGSSQECIKTHKKLQKKATWKIQWQLVVEVPAPALININRSFPIDGAHSGREEPGSTVAF